MTIDLFPKLYLLFPTPAKASLFELQCGEVLDCLEFEQDGCKLTITGADHPCMRLDIIDAAKTLGGDEISSGNYLQ